MENTTTPKKGLNDHQQLVLKYALTIFVFAMAITLFSLLMAGVVSYRNEVTVSNYDSVSSVYNGPLTQAAPEIRALTAADGVYNDLKLVETKAQQYAENTALASTNGEVKITADFVKKGLTYQPGYRTQFKADYVLKNNLKEESAVSFQFPFPSATQNGEISNARLLVDGTEIENAKTELAITEPVVDEYVYDDYYPTATSAQGLKWDGKIPANSSVKVTVQYDTVGLDIFTYEGIDNPQGAQDFNFVVNISGIRSYNVLNGLSVDKKTFGAQSVALVWNKPALYSKPQLSVQVGDKVNPSGQVARIYFVMLPVYLLFSIIVTFLTKRFGRKPLSVFDLSLVSVLYILFFPLVHYFSSFTIDPTIEVFAAFNNVPYFSMPLYGAFALAWIATVGVVLYYFTRTQGGTFTMKFILPCAALFVGFFPLVVTVPEYSVLLSLLGLLALVTIIAQSRIQSLKHQA